MSTEAWDPKEDEPSLSLGEYILALVRELGRADPPAWERMRRVVGIRRARIVLDEEAVEVWFGTRGLVVRNGESPRPVDGEGATDRGTVLALLDGSLEVTEAIASGRLHVMGTPDATVRMFTAIEILLDGSARIPAMQNLARRFRASDEARSSPRPASGPPSWTSEQAPPESQMQLLGRLGLLPDG